MRLNRQVCLNCLFPILSHFRAFLSATFPFFSYNRQDPDSIHSSFHSQPLILTVSLRPGSLIGGHRESVDSGNSSTSEDDFPGLQTNVIPASGSEGLSLASSQGTIRRGRGAQQLTVRPADAAAAVGSPALGYSFGTTLYPRSSETSDGRGLEAPRSRSPRNRRAQGQQRVLSYLSEVSHAGTTLTNFGEDLGVPAPPSPHLSWSLPAVVPTNPWMRVAFWVLLTLIIALLPVYIWMAGFLFGRT